MSGASRGAAQDAQAAAVRAPHDAMSKRRAGWRRREEEPAPARGGCPGVEGDRRGGRAVGSKGRLDLDLDVRVR